MQDSQSLTKKHKKRGFFEPLLLVLLITFSWILFAFNTDNADYNNYLNAYNAALHGASNEYLEPGFFFLMKICILAKLPYQGFLIVVATITLLIFIYSIKKMSNNLVGVLACVIIYPLVFDIVQYRNFLAFTICLYGVHIILADVVKKKDILKFCLIIATATLFHASAIVYLIFLLTLFKQTTKVLKIALLGFCSLILLANFKNLFFQILTSLGFSNYARYDIDLNYSTFLQYLALYSLFLILSLWKYKGNYNNKKIKLILSLMLLIPFIIFNGTSARLFRNTFVLVYIVLLERHEKNVASISVKRLAISLGLLLALILVFYMQLAQGLYYETVLVPVLTENILF